MDSSRLFFGVALESPAVQSIEEAVATLSARDFPGPLVPSENWHLTLRFLGKTTEKQKEEILQKMEARPLPGPAEIKIGGWGAFPRPSAARVLWLGVDDASGTLGDLSALLESVAGEIGFPPEDRPFRPHLTLARLRTPADLRPLLPTLPPVQAASRVDRLILFRSDLGAGPPRYSTVETFPLAEPCGLNQ